ncbi:hypothetical protein SAMN05660964_01405 [Thiothrix caldifontis]|uniref:Uncharacterized protein n=1 Tax=Thiothrix caldifontis TaxID=525918 RepID=A0A1H4ACL3_9GAMM|nr:hypothetical protein [Thiothrix caldifontis]SEA33687.1 hypothetical protein SAMN05660964_01405 [Thiothrix caldifontis]
MLGQNNCVIALLVAATLLMASPVDARLKNHPISQETVDTRIVPPDLYEKLRTLLGEKFYRDLLQHNEFIVLQELVLTHFETHYPVYSKQ